MIRTFRARYDSDCNRCGSAIFADDEIGYVDGEVACGICVDQANQEEYETVNSWKPPPVVQ